MSFKLAVRYLMGRKLRTVLTTLSILFGVMLIFSLNGLMPVINAVFQDSVRNSAHQVDLIMNHEAELFFDEGRADEILSIDGIELVSPAMEETLFLGDQYSFGTENDPIEHLTINGFDIGTSQQTIPLEILDGRWFQEGDKNVAMARETFLERSGKEVGDTITLPTANATMTFTIIAKVPQMPVLGYEELYITLDDAQYLFNREGQINSLLGIFDPAYDSDALRDEVEMVMGEGYVTDTIDSGSNEWEAMLNMSSTIFMTIGVLALVMGGFIMYNTFKISISERKRDIGMLRTLGATKSDVLKVVLFEGVIQGVVGTVLGIVVGYFVLMAMIPMIQSVWEDLLNVQMGMPEFSAQLFVMAFMLGVGIPVISILIPARKAMRIEPLDAVRVTVSERLDTMNLTRRNVGLVLIVIGAATLFADVPYMSFMSAFLMTVGLIIISPYLIKPLLRIIDRLMFVKGGSAWQIALGNISANPKRSSATAVSMLISVTVIISLIGLSSTFNVGFDRYMDNSIRSDYLVIPNSLMLGSEGVIGASDSFTQKIQNIEGVDDLTAIKYSEASIDGTAINIMGIEPDSYQRLSGLTFIEGDKTTSYETMKEGRRIIINGALATTGPYNVGDMIPIMTSNGVIKYEVVALGIDYLNSRVPTAFVTHDVIINDFGAKNNVLYMINRTENADKKILGESLLEVANEYSNFSVMDYEVWSEMINEGNNTRNMFMYFIVSILALPALIALANTLSMSVVERTREIGMLRAVGMTRKQTRKMIVYESLVISLIGVILGLVSGTVFGYAFVDMINVSRFFVIEYFFPIAAIIVAVTVGILFGVLASRAAVRRATRLNIVESVQYE